MEDIRVKFASNKKLDEEVQGLREESKANYVLRRKFNSEFHTVNSLLDRVEIEQTKINKMQEAQVKVLEGVKERMHKKAETAQLKKMEDKFKNYATFRDLKELYDKVVPQLSNFEDSM